MRPLPNKRLQRTRLRRAAEPLSRWAMVSMTERACQAVP
jgi:hypothetical protein